MITSSSSYTTLERLAGRLSAAQGRCNFEVYRLDVGSDAVSMGPSEKMFVWITVQDLDSSVAFQQSPGCKAQKSNSSAISASRMVNAVANGMNIA